MLVITNRNINDGVTDETAFGERVNDKGPNELRLAHAVKRKGGWTVTLVEEPAVLTEANLPSRIEYKKLLKKCQTSGKHCVFFIHGFSKTFPETLEQGALIEKRYGVEAVVFSWPSKPGGFTTVEYRKARRIAQASFGALDAALEKFGRYVIEQPFDRDALVECSISINFMAYSLGNYLFQNYVVSNDYAAETRIFANVILCQADVDSEKHAGWVNQIVAGQRVYATLNENDKVLAWSESVNYARLGRTLANLEAANTVYVDVTRGEGVGNEHQIWGKVDNPAVTDFFRKVFAGVRGEDASSFRYDERVNAFRL